MGEREGCFFSSALFASFSFIDENIPETGEQLLRSTYGSGCCYEYCEKRRAITPLAPVGYHDSQRSHYEIGSCNVGCDGTSDPSHEAKNGMSLCQTPSTTSTTTASKPATSNTPSIPFVNFPLSSCPSASSSSTSNDASESTQNYSATNAPFNLLILTLILCLYVTNAKIDDWR